MARIKVNFLVNVTFLRYNITMNGKEGFYGMPICDITYTRKGYVPEPWYTRMPEKVPDLWLAYLDVRSAVDPKPPVYCNYRGEKAGIFLTWCDIKDPQAVLNLLDEGETPPVTCVPSLNRYTSDSLYRKAVDEYNAALVRAALYNPEDEEEEEY